MISVAIEHSILSNVSATTRRGHVRIPLSLLTIDGLAPGPNVAVRDTTVSIVVGTSTTLSVELR
jgi:hypothetical protein